MLGKSGNEEVARFNQPGVASKFPDGALVGLALSSIFGGAPHRRSPKGRGWPPTTRETSLVIFLSTNLASTPHSDLTKPIARNNLWKHGARSEGVPTINGQEDCEGAFEPKYQQEC
jgi:hypothetical protein